MPAADPSGVGPHALGELLDLLRGAVVQPELFDLPAMLAFASQSKSSVYRAMSGGQFPQPVQTPSGRRWRRKDLLKWIERLR